MFSYTIIVYSKDPFSVTSSHRCSFYLSLHHGPLRNASRPPSPARAPRLPPITPPVARLATLSGAGAVTQSYQPKLSPAPVGGMTNEDVEALVTYSKLAQAGSAPPSAEGASTAAKRSPAIVDKLPGIPALHGPEAC